MGSLNNLLSVPYYTGLGFGTSSDVPYKYSASIDGNVYIIDDKAYERQMLDITRQGADTSSEPGEASLNNNGLWPRHGINWVGGAGQRIYDDKDGNRTRFWQSQGVNPWTPNQISLLNDTGQRRSSANTNLKLMVAGTYLYMSDGNGVVFTSDPSVGSPTFTAATGLAASSVLDMTTDGTNVFITQATAVYKAAIGAAAFTSFCAGSFQVAQVVNGRLMAGRDNVIGEIDNAGTFTATYTHNSASFRFATIWTGPIRIYAAGAANGKGDVFKIGVNESTGALTTATIATFLPPGEVLYAALFYAGFMLLATSLGIRLASVDSTDGSLTYGPAIDDAGAVRCLASDGLYVWFGWSNLSSSVTGIGRIGFDSPFVGTLTPPFASDLMAAGQGLVTGVARFNSLTYFVASGLGLYGEQSGSQVGSGYFDTGWITYGTPESKTYLNVDMHHFAMPTSASISVATLLETGVQTTIGQSSVAGSYVPAGTLQIGDVRVDKLRLIFTLNKGAATGPTLTRWTVRAAPTPDRQELILVPVVLFSTVATGIEETIPEDQDRMAQYLALLTLARNGRVVVYQEGVYTWMVKVVGVALKAAKWDSERNWFESTMNVTLMTVGA